MEDQNLTTRLLTAKTATGKSEPVLLRGAKHTVTADGKTSAGAGAATVKIYGTSMETPTISSTTGLPTVDGEWKLLGTITLVLGTTNVADSFPIDAKYKWLHVDLTAISGTDAAVNVAMGG